jgi:hypothetical protein
MANDSFNRSDVWRLYDMGYTEEACRLLEHVEQGGEYSVNYLEKNLGYNYPSYNSRDSEIIEILTNPVRDR